MPSRIQILILAAVMTILLTSMMKVSAQNQVEYEIDISDDGSAAWVIRQTLMINDTHDNLYQFQDKVEALVDTARNETARDMSAEAISISSSIFGSYVSVEYAFLWHNFSKTESGDILIGDVFEIHDLFRRLYGDGAVQITYPPTYRINRIAPSPSLRDDSVRLLEWLGTAEFDSGTVDIAFTGEAGSSGFFETLGQNAVLIGGVATIAAGSIAGILAFKHMKNKKGKPVETPLPLASPGMESDEEQVIRMLRSVGGSAYQSAMTDHFRFSRSKTSLLLSVMEKNGIIERRRKGRDKIVTLIETRPKDDEA